MDVRKAANSLETSPWGLVLAYVICVVVSYLAVWALIEPLGIPEDMGGLTSTLPFATQRWFAHAISSFIIGAFLTLMLDFAFRKRLLKKAQGPIAAQTLREYDEAYNDFSKRLAYAMGRCWEHNKSPREHSETYVMKQINEVRTARMRLLKVCGEQLMVSAIYNRTYVPAVRIGLHEKSSGPHAE